MDDATPALKLLNPSSEVKLVGQAIESGRSRFGNASERVIVSVAAGSSAQLAYDLPEAIVLGETRLTAWVSCNRPGAQLAAVVVLPRATDEETGERRRLLIRSNKNGRGGDWEQLDFAEIAKELPAQARVARGPLRRRDG